jgi:diaminopimelate decarboxylase
MTVETLTRVLWRLRKRNPGTDVVTYYELKRAIMYECGTSPVTYRNNRKALRELRWIKAKSKTQIILTGKDITD